MHLPVQQRQLEEFSTSIEGLTVGAAYAGQMFPAAAMSLPAFTRLAEGHPLLLGTQKAAVITLSPGSRGPIDVDCTMIDRGGRLTGSRSELLVEACDTPVELRATLADMLRGMLSESHAAAGHLQPQAHQPESDQQNWRLRSAWAISSLGYSPQQAITVASIAWGLRTLHHSGAIAAICASLLDARGNPWGFPSIQFAQSLKDFDSAAREDLWSGNTRADLTFKLDSSALGETSQEWRYWLDGLTSIDPECPLLRTLTCLAADYSEAHQDVTVSVVEPSGIRLASVRPVSGPPWAFCEASPPAPTPRRGARP